MLVRIDKARVEIIKTASSIDPGIRMDALRLDLIHPVISGNKWFKLRPYLDEAETLHKKKILTWGGAWSNHIVAAAAACRESGYSLTVLVRGEMPAVLSSTLENTMSLGAEIFYLSRDDYRKKTIPPFIDIEDFYCIPEGGSGEPGVSGASGIADLFEFSEYTHIICAAGTGTMSAGLLRRTRPNQELIVIPVLKGFKELENLVRKMAGTGPGKLTLHHEYHFGGYARSDPRLFSFMNDLFEKTGIPTDVVYTGKLFYAAMDMLAKKYFTDGSRILVIHSGGLQGNESLQKGTLIF